MNELGGWVLLQLTLAKTAPLLLAGIGGLASERTGVINIALAALIFGKWHPLGVVAACLFFGFAEAVADGLQGWMTRIPPQLFLALPFALTMEGGPQTADDRPPTMDDGGRRTAHGRQRRVDCAVTELEAPRARGRTGSRNRLR